MTTSNKIFTLCAISLIIIASGCKKNSELSGLPPDLIPADLDTIQAARLDTLLPRKNAMELHPNLFTSTIQKKVVLTKDAEIYVTFLRQSAAYRNSFGWYVRVNDEKPPLDTLKNHILFPNITVPPLKNGDKIQVGKQKFKAGTVLEFFLIVRGWTGQGVNFDALTLYTDASLNPNGYQQSILFRDIRYGTICLGFEDILQDDVKNQYYDNDFNDALFAISDNIDGHRTTAIDTVKMASI